MLDLLKKAGLSAVLAAIIVLAITIIPIWYQIETTKHQNAKIEALEAAVKTLSTK